MSVIYLCFIILYFLPGLCSFSQNIVDEYKLPKVIEGSNLSIYANPNLYITKYDNSSQSNLVSIFANISSSYSKWRLTNKIDYSIKAGLSTSFYKLTRTYFDERNFLAAVSFNIRGGLSYYLTKNKFFIGSYTEAAQTISSSSKPSSYISVYPFIGYGKIVDAFVVNETSNFERVLKRENYINRPFDKVTRQLINSLLDKKNGNEFSSKYKDDADIEFFTELEEYLIKKNIINKPLNARTTLKLYQTLKNSSFILFPLYKGYQFQAEFNYMNSNRKDTSVFPQTITLNAVYGLPMGKNNSLLFSSHFIIPLNNDYNIDFVRLFMHSPVFLKSEFQKINNYEEINPSIISLYDKLFDYKVAAKIGIFQYLSETAGFNANIEYTLGKVKKPAVNYKYFLEANAILIFNILNKLRLSSGIYFTHFAERKYRFSIYNSFTYSIF